LFYSHGDRSKQEFFIDQVTDPAEQERSRANLDRMVGFAESPTCRRAYVLRYFGETWETENCGGCDVCLAGVEEFDATVVAQKILSAVIRTEERFGMAHVAKVLRGSRDKKIAQAGHNDLSVYGIERDHSEDAIKEIGRRLVDQGLLETSGGQYPTVSVSSRGRQFLNARETLTLTRPKAKAIASSRRAPHLDYDIGLFDLLRDVRRKLAEEQGVPPYVVFSDVSLVQMAYFAPRSREGFSGITGVGEMKLERYGALFLKHIAEYADEHGVDERQVTTPAVSKSASRRVQREGSTYQETSQMFADGQTVAQIATARGLSSGTIIGHLERLAASGDDIDITHTISAERLDTIRTAFVKSGGIMMTPVRELLGPSYSYDEIRLARLAIAAEAKHGREEAATAVPTG